MLASTVTFRVLVCPAGTVIRALTPVVLLSGMARGTLVAEKLWTTPPPPPPQVGSAAWTGTLTASHAALTVLNCVQLPGNRLMAACNVQVRYFRYDAPVVLSSIALYMILIAFCGPRPTTVELLQVGLTG